MAKICFVTYEIHPTNRGGCGVLLHHAAELLLRDGHEVAFLLAMPRHEFERFDRVDRLAFANAHNCRAFHLDGLAGDVGLSMNECPVGSIRESVRFARAVENLLAKEHFDFVEFFEYCGAAYHALSRKLFGVGALGQTNAVLGTRLHNSLELIDAVGSTRYLDRSRAMLYALEHGQLNLSEAVLTPTGAYYERYYKDRYNLPPSKVVESQSPKLPFPRVTRRPDPSRESFSIVYIGRLYQFKGVDQLVRAGVEFLERRPGVRCTFDIIGADSSESPLGHSYKEYLLSMVPAALRDRFEFPGNLSHEEFGKHLDRALFAVFPNRFESFCYAAHEVYDAGVPMLVRDLPGWSDFFTHEKNALVYDGRTDHLVEQMERLLDDGVLRERLCKPYEIATTPLGGGTADLGGIFYQAPKALDPLACPNRSIPGVLAIVLCERASDPAATLRALRAQVHGSSRTLVLREADAAAGGAFWFLGRAWDAKVYANGSEADANGADLTSLDAVVVLRAGDEPRANWLHACVTALGTRRNLAFAGTWARTSGPQNRVIAGDLDLAPEAYPFEHGTRTTRAVIRTTHGLPLGDVFDPVLAGLGEIGLIWKTIHATGPGALLDEALMSVRESKPEPADANLLKHLLSTLGGPFAERLALYAGLQQDRIDGLHAQMRSLAQHANVALPEAKAADPTLEHKIRVADELGGKTLARLAWRKLARKVSGKKPTG